MPSKCVRCRARNCECSYERPACAACRQTSFRPEHLHMLCIYDLDDKDDDDEDDDASVSGDALAPTGGRTSQVSHERRFPSNEVERGGWRRCTRCVECNFECDGDLPCSACPPFIPGVPPCCVYPPSSSSTLAPVVRLPPPHRLPPQPLHLQPEQASRAAVPVVEEAEARYLEYVERTPREIEEMDVARLQAGVGGAGMAPGMGVTDGIGSGLGGMSMDDWFSGGQGGSGGVAGSIASGGAEASHTLAVGESSGAGLRPQDGWQPQAAQATPFVPPPLPQLPPPPIGRQLAAAWLPTGTPAQGGSEWSTDPVMLQTHPSQRVSPLAAVPPEMVFGAPGAFDALGQDTSFTDVSAGQLSAADAILFNLPPTLDMSSVSTGQITGMGAGQGETAGATFASPLDMYASTDQGEADNTSSPDLSTLFTFAPAQAPQAPPPLYASTSSLPREPVIPEPVVAFNPGPGDTASLVTDDISSANPISPLYPSPHGMLPGFRLSQSDLLENPELTPAAQTAVSQAMLFQATTSAPLTFPYRPTALPQIPPHQPTGAPHISPPQLSPVRSYPQPSTASSTASLISPPQLAPSGSYRPIAPNPAPVQPPHVAPPQHTLPSPSRGYYSYDNFAFQGGARPPATPGAPSVGGFGRWVGPGTSTLPPMLSPPQTANTSLPPLLAHQQTQREQRERLGDRDWDHEQALLRMQEEAQGKVNPARSALGLSFPPPGGGGSKKGGRKQEQRSEEEEQEWDEEKHKRDLDHQREWRQRQLEMKEIQEKQSRRRQQVQAQEKGEARQTVPEQQQLEMKEIQERQSKRRRQVQAQEEEEARQKALEQQQQHQEQQHAVQQQPQYHFPQPTQQHHWFRPQPQQQQQQNLQQQQQWYSQQQQQYPQQQHYQPPQPQPHYQYPHPQHYPAPHQYRPVQYPQAGNPVVQPSSYTPGRVSTGQPAGGGGFQQHDPALQRQVQAQLSMRAEAANQPGPLPTMQPAEQGPVRPLPMQQPGPMAYGGFQPAMYNPYPPPPGYPWPARPAPGPAGASTQYGAPQAGGFSAAGGAGNSGAHEGGGQAGEGSGGTGYDGMGGN
ncbi:hypothetical protein IAT38_004964 [Cryptococcus sp. DSM 104549]